MTTYITRWDDGSAHVGIAQNREDLQDLLDEIGSPTHARWRTAGSARMAIDVSPPVFDPDLAMDFSIKLSACDSAETVPSNEEWSAALEADLDTSPLGFKRGTVPRCEG